MSEPPACPRKCLAGQAACFVPGQPRGTIVALLKYAPLCHHTRMQSPVGSTKSPVSTTTLTTSAPAAPA